MALGIEILRARQAMQRKYLNQVPSALIMLDSTLTGCQRCVGLCACVSTACPADRRALHRFQRSQDASAGQGGNPSELLRIT